MFVQQKSQNSSNSSSARSSVSSLSSDHLNSTTHTNKAKVNDGYFNNTYFKITGETKLKKKCHSMKVNGHSGQAAVQYRCGGYQSSHAAPIVKRNHSDTLKNDQFPSQIIHSDSTFETKHHPKRLKQEQTDTNLVDIRNLSIEVATVSSAVASPSSTCSYSSLVSTTSSVFHNLTTLTSTLFTQVDNIKQLIRQANSESTIKNLLTELTSSVAEFILKQSNTSSKAISNGSIHNGNSLGQVEFEMNRELIIAYSYLIDGTESTSYLACLSTCVSPYEVRVKDILSRVYTNTNTNSCKKVTGELATEKLFSSFDVTDFNQTDFNPSLALNTNEEFNLGFSNLQDDYEVLNLPNLNEVDMETAILTTTKTNISSKTKELKTLHFLLLLFTSLISLNGFISQLTSEENEMSLDASYCQKFLVKLLDRVCEDKSVRTKILLSVPEIELF